MFSAIKPLSAASAASLRIAANRKLIVLGAYPLFSNSCALYAFTAAFVSPGAPLFVYQAIKSSIACAYAVLLCGLFSPSITRAFIAASSGARVVVTNSLSHFAACSAFVFYNSYYNKLFVLLCQEKKGYNLVTLRLLSGRFSPVIWKKALK